jgi:Acyl-CoA dehydrogenases
MQFSFTEDQEMIRQSVVELAARACPISEVRAFGQSEAAYSDRLWQDLAGAGFLGALIPEAHGGSDLGMLEAGIVLEVLGGALASVPYLSTAVAAADLIGRIGTDAQKAQWLPKIAAGQISVAIAGWPEPGVVSDDGQMQGHWAPVANAAGADLLLAVLNDGGVNAQVVVLENSHADAMAEDFPTMDRTRRFGAVKLAGTVAERLEKPLDAAGQARLGAILAAGSAAEMMGGASRAMDMAANYAKERIQFGRPIGTFQAIKHMLADQLVALEGLRSVVWRALWSIDHAPEDALFAAVTAKAVADKVVLQIASENIQVHGGSGFTTDIDAHLYVKRAQLDRMVWGPPSHHTDLLEQRLVDLA